MTSITTAHRIVSREDWIAARKALLEKEKELSKLRDQLAAARQALPWVKVEKSYVFDAPGGKKALADLFDGRSQLIIYHFMLAPSEKADCTGCSFFADHVDAARQHFEHHDVSFAAVSRAPLDEIEAYKTRMGWRFAWVSSAGGDFNYDYHVSFRPEDLAKGKVYYNYETMRNSGRYQGGDMHGVSVFYKDDAGAVFHTYSHYARGGDILLGAHNFLDLTPKGRNETTIMDWMRRHDEYEDAKPASCCS